MSFDSDHFETPVHCVIWLLSSSHRLLFESRSDLRENPPASGEATMPLADRGKVFLSARGSTNFTSVAHGTLTILLSHEDRPSDSPQGVPGPMDNHTLTHQIRGGRTNSLNRRMLSTIGMPLIFTCMLLSGSMPGMFLPGGNLAMAQTSPDFGPKPKYC